MTYDFEEEGRNYDRVSLAIYRALTWNLNGCFKIYLEFKPTKDTIEVTIYRGHGEEKRRLDFDIDLYMPTDKITEAVILEIEKDND